MRLGNCKGGSRRLSVSYGNGLVMLSVQSVRGNLVMRDMFQYSPARALTPAEHAVVAEWMAAAGDIASAYVSDRHTDDPAMYRCVVIVTNSADGPSHLIHAPVDEDIWVTFALGKGAKMRTFPSLHAALNSVRPRPVLVKHDA